MIHLDLFSGIGGFSYAVDQVWENVEHIFCENEPFAQQVIKKHWKHSTLLGDIRGLVAYPTNDGRTRWGTLEQRRQAPSDEIGQTTESESEREGRFRELGTIDSVDLLTGGFPCQPFSQAGRRKGTADDRYLWPEMLRVIRAFKPRWVIGENVAGLLTIEQGVVFEQVCAELEAEGYEVQPFIIPAVAVNAPHRRDRVWIVANRGRQRRSQRSDQGVRPESQKSIGTNSSFSGSEWLDKLFALGKTLEQECENKELPYHCIAPLVRLLSHIESAQYICKEQKTKE